MVELFIASVNTLMYGRFMKDRLSKEDWLYHGLEALSAEGVNGLKAEVLAKSLKVSRGSFYWHFKNIGSFNEEVLNLWETLATRQIMEEIDGSTAKPDRLFALMKKAFKSDSNLENSIRDWGARDPKVASKVSSVDEIRVGFIRKLLLQEGIPLVQAQPRASFLYWAYLGQKLAVNSEAASNEQLNEIFKILTTFDG
jgi:AcrR family transcriptional regulator